MAEEQAFIVSVPAHFDATTRKEVGEEIIAHIMQRTSKGLDKNGSPFRGYKDSYKNSKEFAEAGKTKGRVNLKFTGEMIVSMDILRHGPGFIVIGFKPGPANDKAYFAKQPRNSFRDFLGIQQKELRRIINRFDQETREEVTQEIEREFSEELLRRLTSGN